MQLKPGMRLRSRACDAEVIVVRAPDRIDVELTCGGVPMASLDAAAGEPRPIVSGFDGGTQLGKRYTAADESSLEVLVTRAGAGSLALGSSPLVVKQARVLPSSD